MVVEVTAVPSQALEDLMTTIASPPWGTLGQKMGALEKANAIRVGNARLREEIRALPSAAGFERAAGLIECPEGCVASMPVGRLLMAIERVGRGRMLKWLTLVGVRSADRRVDALSDRQRVLLASTLRYEGARYL